MKPKLISILILLFMIYPKQVYAFNYSHCSKLSNQLNSKTPMYVDSATYVKGTFCSDTNPKPTINYIMISTLNSLDINAMTNFQRNYWCTDPDQKKLLYKADIKYQYHTKTGTYLGSTSINIRMCR
jgi:hypothetical protein